MAVGLYNADSRLRASMALLPWCMTATARRWFGLRDDPRLTIRHEDARAFLNRQADTYDLVFVDVFNAHYAVPFQMGTVEAAAALRRAVRPGGAVLMTSSRRKTCIPRRGIARALEAIVRTNGYQV